MNVNFGLFPPLEPGTTSSRKASRRFRGKDKTIMKRQLITRRALADCATWLGRNRRLPKAPERRFYACRIEPGSSDPLEVFALCMSSQNAARFWAA